MNSLKIIAPGRCYSSLLTLSRMPSVAPKFLSHFISDKSGKSGPEINYFCFTFSNICLSCQAGERALATKSIDLSFILGIHRWKERNSSFKFSSNFKACSWCMYVCRYITYIYIANKLNKCDFCSTCLLLRDKYERSYF